MRLGADPGLDGRTLGTSEVIGFLARHPAAAARVAWQKTHTGTCYQLPGDEPWWSFGGYTSERELWGIPARGLYVDDSVLGAVFVFPDPDCSIHYSAVGGEYDGTPIGEIGERVNEPNPEPVPHDRDLWDDLVGFSQGAVAIGFLVLLLRGRT